MQEYCIWHVPGVTLARLIFSFPLSSLILEEDTNADQQAVVAPSLSVESGLSTEGVASIIVALVALVIAVSKPCATRLFRTRPNVSSMSTQKLVEHNGGCMACRWASFCNGQFRSTSHQSSHAYPADATWYSSRGRTKAINRKQ